jgi:hypothetical protein
MNCNEGQVEYKRTKVYDKSEILCTFEAFRSCFMVWKVSQKLTKKNFFF